jgi:hypothetical protein
MWLWVNNLNHFLVCRFGWMSQKDEVKDSATDMTYNPQDRWLLHAC